MVKAGVANPTPTLCRTKYGYLLTKQLLELGEKIGKVSKGLTQTELEGLKRTIYGRHKGGKADQYYHL